MRPRPRAAPCNYLPNRNGCPQDLVLMRCLARVADPCKLEHLSKLRLSVREPLACFPCFSRRRTFVTLRFSGYGAWRRHPRDNRSEQYSDTVAVNLGKFRHLKEDLVVTVTVWAQRWVDHSRLCRRLGQFLNHLPALSQLTLLMAVCFGLGWLVPSNTIDRYTVHNDDRWPARGPWIRRVDELDDKDLDMPSMLGGQPPSQQHAISGDLPDPPNTHTVPATTSLGLPNTPAPHTRRAQLAPPRKSRRRRPPPWLRKEHRRHKGHATPTTATTTKRHTVAVPWTFLFLAVVLRVLQHCAQGTY